MGRKTTKTASRPKTPAPGPTEACASDHRAAFSQDEGVFRAHEPALFRAGCEALCCRIAHAIARQPEVRMVEICLDSATCRVAFAPGQVTAAQMAERFAEGVKLAVSGASADPRRGSERGWRALTVFPHGETVSTWETVRAGDGELRLRNRVLNKDSGLAREVARALAQAPGVQSCRVTRLSRHLLIQFDPAVTAPGRVRTAAEEAFRHALRPALDRSTTEASAAPAVARGLHRAGYLALAGGSFALTLVGLIIPGVPTVPFLLATSYYLVRSSPRLNRALLASRFFGPIVSDLQTWGGLRRVNKLKLIGLTVVVSVVTTVIAGPPLVLVLVMVSVASASVYAISRLPGTPPRARRAPALAG